MRSLPILYQDDVLVAVNKPSGLLVHRSPIDRHETEFALQTVRDQIGRRVHPVHRLDKATSGALVFALDPDAARAMMAAFQQGAVEKTYLAVVRGFADEAGRIEHPLREPTDRMSGQRAGEEKAAQEAVTEYRRLATAELPHSAGRHPTSRFSLVHAFPRTGRTHQVRRHLKHVFHPVIGDTTYGDGRQNELFRRVFDCRRLLLHARGIAFPHPSTGAPVRIAAPPDASLAALLQRLGWGSEALMNNDRHGDAETQRKD